MPTTHFKSKTSHTKTFIFDSALTGMTQEIIVRLFKFRPVIIGAPLNINGASFRFFYTFYGVPTIGFEIYNQDKSVYFSSDTLFDPKRYILAN